MDFSVSDILDFIAIILALVILVGFIWSVTAAHGWKGFLGVIGVISGVVFLTSGIENLFDYIFKNNNLPLFVGLILIMAIFLIGLFLGTIFEQCINLDKNGKKDYIKKLLKEIAILVGFFAAGTLTIYFVFKFFIFYY